MEKAKQIVLEDAGLDEAAQKIVFTREELSRNSGKPCYILEFYTDKCAYSYKVDAVSGDITGKKTDWFFLSGVRDCAGHISKIPIPSSAEQVKL